MSLFMKVPSGYNQNINFSISLIDQFLVRWKQMLHIGNPIYTNRILSWTFAFYLLTNFFEKAGIQNKESKESTTNQ